MNTSLPKLIAVDSRIMKLLLQQIFPETVQESVLGDMQVLKVRLPQFSRFVLMLLPYETICCKLAHFKYIIPSVSHSL